MEFLFAENATLLELLLLRCPPFAKILEHILGNKFGYRAKKVDWMSDFEDWEEEDFKNVGRSFATFVRKRKRER